MSKSFKTEVVMLINTKYVSSDKVRVDKHLEEIQGRDCPFCSGAGYIDYGEHGLACKNCDGEGIFEYTKLIKYEAEVTINNIKVIVDNNMNISIGYLYKDNNNTNIYVEEGKINSINNNFSGLRIETLYNIGDSVNIKVRKVDVINCPFCNGEGFINYSGTDIECPNCNDGIFKISTNELEDIICEIIEINVYVKEDNTTSITYTGSYQLNNKSTMEYCFGQDRIIGVIAKKGDDIKESA